MEDDKQLPLSVVELLNNSRGVVEIPNLEDVSVDPDKRTNITLLAGRLGMALHSEPRGTLTTDKPLEVYFNDLGKARPHYLQGGLLIEPSDSRYRHAQQLVVVGHQPPDPSLPNTVPRTTGVVFPSDEFKIVARNAKDLVKHVRATTRASQLKQAENENKNVNREEIEEAVRRSSAHALRSKVEGMRSLDLDILDEIYLLEKIHKDSKLVWRTAYLGKNLNRDRKQADELIHETAEVAAINLNLGTTATNAMHRGLTSELYRRGSSKELAYNWRNTTAWVAYYLKAKRGKISQSSKDCGHLFWKYARSLSPEERNLS